jgi:hypothetical protein
MQSSQDGYLLIADITGYTAFLRESELEHAKESLRSLLDLLIESTRPPLVISRLEGDAVISYAPDGSFLQGQTLVELIEGTYVEFRRALDLMVLNTSCNCLACRNISNLDLKFFVHYGRFALEQLPQYTELIGTDVNLIHRLTKNTVSKELGYHAYVLYTRAALEQLGIPEMFNELTPHIESYEDVGEINTYLFDMHPVWETRKHRLHTVVEPEEAIYTIEEDFPVASVLLWEYFTKPEFRAIILGSDSQRIEDMKEGRIADGSVYVCAHGKNIVKQSIVDWHPFEQYTIKSPVPGGGVGLATTHFTPYQDGTKVTIYLGKTQKGSPFVRGLANFIGRKKAGPTFREGVGALKALVESDIQAGKIARQPVIEIQDAQIESALADSLAQT